METEYNDTKILIYNYWEQLKRFKRLETIFAHWKGVVWVKREQGVVVLVGSGWVRKSQRPVSVAKHSVIMMGVGVDKTYGPSAKHWPAVFSPEGVWHPSDPHTRNIRTGTDVWAKTHLPIVLNIVGL